MGCDRLFLDQLFAERRVSIHAPAWGATSAPVYCVLQPTVSIHAPAWGATRQPTPTCTAAAGFNPRTRVGCDPDQQPHLLSRPCFNPRTRVGCDGLPRAAVRAVGSFNPRTRVGCDHTGVQSGSDNTGFNPRTRVGCDAGVGACVRFSGGVSIHAPAWGATISPASSTCWPDSFNPRTRVGCDHVRKGRFVRNDGFNPRTRVGCDRQRLMLVPTLNLFQSTHPRGVRQEHRALYGSRYVVSIHAPAWGATFTSFSRAAL